MAQAHARARGGALSGAPVALVVGAGVDTAWVRDRIRESGRDPAQLPPDSLMDPASVGATYWMLHQQPRDAWTFELELRPYRETW